MLDCRTPLEIEKVLEALSAHRFTPRSSWWIALVCVECILDPANHQTLFEGAVCAYRADDETVAVEFALKGGWTDRRHLHPITVNCLARNQGCFFRKEDLKNVDRELADVFNLGQGKHRQQLIAAAINFWSTRMPGVLFGHCTGNDRFQLLNRHSLWRRATHAVASITSKGDVTMDFLGWQQFSKNLVTAEFVVDQIEDIARRTGSRNAGRQLMVDCIDHQFPAAKVEGQMQALALLCLKEVIKTGGMSGNLLAPSSISTYLGTTFVPWVKALIDLGMESETESYINSYSAIIDAHPRSRRGQAKALIDILHTRLVLRGAPFLRAPGKAQLTSVPRAQVIWPHETELALEYLSRVTADPRLAAQARLVILLGLEIPLRTSEYFQIRLVDVCPKSIASMVLFPRRKDGTHKSPHNRLHADISSVGLCNELMAYKMLRCAEEALPSEDSSPDMFFFGMPGHPETAFADGETVELVNRALRWATGDNQASVYSLRHTVISARALTCLNMEGNTDAIAWEAMSKQCGHGNPDSTDVYVHQIEEPLRRAIARYVHAKLIECNPQGGSISALKDLYEVKQRPTVEQVPPRAPKKLQELSAEQFIDLMSELATDTESPVVLAMFGLEAGALGQLFQLVKYRWSERGNPLLTERDVRVAILGWGTRAKHARQSKYEKFKRHLQKISVDTPGARGLASALNDCCLKIDITLDTGYWSDVFFQSLIAAGYRKDEMVLFSETTDILPNGYGRHGTWRKQSFRRGRPLIRLGLIDCHTCTPLKASAAAYSATGFSWFARTLNLWLASQGEM